MRAWIVVGLVAVALVGLVVTLASRTPAEHAAPRRPRARPSAPPRRCRIDTKPEGPDAARHITTTDTVAGTGTIDLRARTGGQCPHCGRAGSPQRIGRNRSLTSWRCAWCDHQWEVADGEPWPDVTLCLWIPRAPAPTAREAR